MTCDTTILGLLLYLEVQNVSQNPYQSPAGGGDAKLLLGLALNPSPSVLHAGRDPEHCGPRRGVSTRRIKRVIY